MMWLYGFTNVMQNDPDFDEFVSEIYKLKLTLSELDEVLCYAKDIKEREQIEKEKPHVAYAIKNIFSKMLWN